MDSTGAYHLAVFVRFLHVLSAIFWIGLLYFFNVVNVPTMKALDAATKGKVVPVLLPKALLWFRYSAVATLVFGLALLFTPSLYPSPANWDWKILTGVGLAVIMFFNVWAIIWPNQKKALGIVQVEPAEKARAARLAMLASRFNTMLSIPMLYCMVAQQNGGL